MRGFGRQRRRRSTATPACIEDVLSERVLADPMVDRDELDALLKDPSPLRAYVDVDPEPADQFLPEPESTVARLSKLAGLVLAVALLCGSLVTAAFLDRQRVAAQEAPPPRQITGIAALAGFAMPPQQPPVKEPVTERAATVLADVPARPRTSQDVTTSPSPAARTEADIDRFTRDFYQRFASAPDDALAMLGDDLLEDRQEELAEALRQIDTVTVHEVTVGRNGLVHAVITVTHSDTRRYRVSHVLRVEAGPPALITEARLLSAQQDPGEE